MCGKTVINNILKSNSDTNLINSNYYCEICGLHQIEINKICNNCSVKKINNFDKIQENPIEISKQIMAITQSNNLQDHQHHQSNDIKIVNKENPKVEDDILAIITQWTRHFVQKCNNFARKIQRTKAYKILSRTTQPAHVIAILILSFVLLAIWPNLLESEEEKNLTKVKPKNHSSLTLVTYLGAFAAHFGAQIWMTFVSGLSLYFALPRHTFGQCQQVLFPKYFAMNSILSICTLILFVKMIGSKWELSSYIQVIALTICAIIEVFVRLYLAPPLLRLMHEKHRFESRTGSGQEVGYLKQGALSRCPHYQNIHKTFRKIHMIVAIANITTLVCTFLHLHYLASRIRVS